MNPAGETHAGPVWSRLGPRLEAGGGSSRALPISARARAIVTLPGPPGAALRTLARRALAGGFAFLALLSESAARPAGDARRRELERLRQALARASGEVSSGDAETSSDVERALAGALGPRGFCRLDLGAALDASREEQRMATQPSSTELERRALVLGGRPTAALVRACGSTSPRDLARADALDTARRLAEWARDVLREARAGRLRLALDELGPAGLGPADLFEPDADRSPALREALAARVGRVRGLLAKAADAREGLPAPERWMLRAHARRTEAVCRRLELRGFRPARA